MRYPWPFVAAAGLVAACATVEREPPATAQKANDQYEVPPAQGPAYGPEVTAPVQAWLGWAVGPDAEPTALSLDTIRTGMKHLDTALAALETTEPELRDALRARAERFHATARELVELPPTDPAIARATRDTLVAAADLLQEVARGRLEANPSLGDDIAGARRAANALDPSRPLAEQRDALAAAFTATIAPMATLANVRAPARKSPADAPLPLTTPEASPAVPE